MRHQQPGEDKRDVVECHSRFWQLICRQKVSSDEGRVFPDPKNLVFEREGQIANHRGTETTEFLGKLTPNKGDSAKGCSGMRSD